MTLLQFHSLKSQMHSGNLKIMIFLRAVSVRLSWSRMRSLSQSTFENFHLQKGFYIFTLLMFRKTNKTTINKNKTINSYTSFRFSFIFRYFKAFQLSPNIHIWSVWFVITCGQLVSCFLLLFFVFWGYILKVHVHVSSEHPLCHIWNTCIVTCI